MRIFDDGQGFTVTTVQERGVPIVLARFQFSRGALSPEVYAAGVLMDRQFTDLTADQCMTLASALLGFATSQSTDDPLSTPLHARNARACSRRHAG